MALGDLVSGAPRRGLTRFLMGSVAEFVARHASSWVEIVRVPRRKG